MLKKTPLKRKRKTAADYALKKNGKPRKAPGKAKGKSLTDGTERLARQACLHDAGHVCCAAGMFDRDCDKIGMRSYLEWCHIFGRNHARLKFHPLNCFCACPVHHDYLDLHPATKHEFIEEKWPGRLSKLAELERTLPKGAKPEFWRDYFKEAGFTTTGRAKGGAD